MNILLQLEKGDGAARVRDLASSRERMVVLGKEAEFQLRAHFLDKNRTPNRNNWPRTNFWNRMRSATQFTGATENVATVTIAAPEFAQKLYGGTITPKEAKWLAIPARQEAYGKSPKLFSDLRFVPSKRGDLAMLVQNASTRVVRKRDGSFGKGESIGGGLVFYFLHKKVTQAPDATALPKQADFERALLAADEEFLTSKAEGRSA